MRYLSICSGIEAASVAWQPLGWEPLAFSEVEPFPCAVIAHHYPHVPNLGDMTKIDGSKYRGAVDLIVGGTPCQSFSVAGKRGGMADPRGALALHFVQLVHDVHPRWFVWENVPGVFSSGGGRDFREFAAALVQCGYHVAWRVLDAQFFGVPQRRRRVFLVGHFGDWRPAAAVLFEPHSLRGNFAPRRKAQSDIAGTVDASLGRSRGAGTPPGAVTQALTGRIGNGADANKAQGGFYVPDIVPQALSCKWAKGTSGPAGDEHHNLIAIHPHCIGRAPGAGPQGKEYLADGSAYTMDGRGTAQCIASVPRMHVRRLTPRECERLQGFPDDYTAITYRNRPAADGPRYKALGNSMAVPVVRWIGSRIATVGAGL